MWIWPVIVIATLIGLPVLSLLLFFTKVTLRVHRKHTVTIKPTFEETRSEDLSEEMREIIGQWIQQFSSQGFEVLANLKNADGVTGAKGIQLLFVQDSTKDTAQTFIVRAAFKRVFSVTVSSDFEDGYRIVTTSRRTVGVLPRNPDVDSIAFPWIKDATTLCEAHRRRVISCGRTESDRRYPTTDTVNSWLKKLWDETLCRSVRVGYLFADPACGVYRYTWKGAILATVKLFAPIRRIRMKRLEAASRKVWNSLKMEDFTAPPTLSLPSSRSGRVISRDVAEHSRLEYANALAPGEVRTEISDGSVTTRIGGNPINGATIRAWINIALSVFIISSLGIEFWISMKLSSISPAVASRREKKMVTLLLTCVISVTFLLFGVISSFQKKKGEGVIFTSREGLRASNVSGIPDTFIPRDEIEGILVVAFKKGFGLKRGRLLLYRFDAKRRYCLVQEADLSALMSARKEMLEAMGMNVTDAPPPLPVGQG